MKGVFRINIGNYHMPINKDSFEKVVDELSLIWKIYVKEYGPFYKYYYIEDSKEYPEPRLVYFGYFDCDDSQENCYEKSR